MVTHPFGTLPGASHARAMTLFMALALVFAAAACGDDSSAEPSIYSASVTTTPTVLVPGQPALLSVAVTDRDGAAAAGIQVDVSATLGSETVDHGALAESAAGVYSVSDFTLGTEGTWNLTVSMEGPDGTVTAETTVSVSCDGDGEEGSNCCDSDGCGAELLCIAGACTAGQAPPGSPCEGATECASDICKGGECAEPACDDSVSNGDESDIDCGGATCASCADGSACGAGSDCQSGVCAEGACAAPACDDTVTNGDETDLDCGGSCTTCETGSVCGTGADCVSGVCTGDLCVAPACDDSVANGEETDLDCGGPCDGCSGDKACNVDADCLSMLCEGGACASSGVEVLGSGSHSMDGLNVEVLGTSANYLTKPTDLAFNPSDPSQLWVTNMSPASMVIFFNVDTPSPTSQYYASGGTPHFMAKPAALAFGEPGDLATIHDEDDYTQGPNGTPKDFMGPTLFTTNLSIFDAGHGGHTDMLHSSPMGGGIAWEKDRIFWVFGGYYNAITRYDFGTDHGPGGSDHSGAIVRRYAKGEVSRYKGIASHLKADAAANLLYISDPINNRIATLDTTSGTVGSTFGPNYDGSDQREVSGATLNTFIEGSAVGMLRPSGLALAGDIIYVTDNSSSQIMAFDKATGDLLDYLDTGLPVGALMGIAVDAAGTLYIVDAVDDRVLRISVQ